jgi:hypothetical protein
MPTGIWSADKPFQILFAFVAPRIRGSRVRRLRRLVHLRFDQWLRARWLYTKPNTGWCCVYDRGLRQRCGSDPPRLSCCYRRGRSALVSAGAEVAPAADMAATQQDARPTGTGAGCGMDAWRHDAVAVDLEINATGRLVLVNDPGGRRKYRWQPPSLRPD